MARIRRWAAVAACLAMCAGGGRGVPAEPRRCGDAAAVDVQSFPGRGRRCRGQLHAEERGQQAMQRRLCVFQAGCAAGQRRWRLADLPAQSQSGPLIQNAVSPPATLPGVRLRRLRHRRREANLHRERHAVRRRRAGGAAGNLYATRLRSASTKARAAGNIQDAGSRAHARRDHRRQLADDLGDCRRRAQDHAELRRLRRGRDALRAVAGLLQSGLPS